MYKNLVSIALLLVVPFCVATVLDSDALTKNDKALTQFISCLLETGLCSTEESQYKEKLPEVLSTNCDKCTNEQKDFFIKTSKFVKENRPEDWKKLNKKYDPGNKYEDKILKLIGAA